MAQILTGIHRTYNRKNVSRLLHQGKDTFSIPVFSLSSPVLEKDTVIEYLSMVFIIRIISSHGSCVCPCSVCRNVSVSNQILLLWCQESFISKSVLTLRSSNRKGIERWAKRRSHTQPSLETLETRAAAAQIRT